MPHDLKYAYTDAEVIAEQLRRDMVADPVVFARKLGFKPDPWQKRLLRSHAKRTLLNCSRQTGKSTVTALRVLHTALFEAGSLILLVSPSERQSGELFRKVIDFLKVYMPEFQEVEASNKTTLELANGSRIVSLPSQESTIRSFSGVRLLVLDEASRVPDDLYGATRPMLMASKGDLIALSSPWGKRGWWWRAWESTEETWERFRVPVYQVARLVQDPETQKFLREEKFSKGERFFAQEYECKFVEIEDSFFSEGLVDAAFDGKVTPLFDGEMPPAEVDQGISVLDFENPGEETS